MPSSIHTYYNSIHHIKNTKLDKQTFVIKLNGPAALGYFNHVTLVNNACNIHLVLVF